MADIYISHSGDDANAGTEGSPYRTFLKAQSQVGAGETIYIEADSEWTVEDQASDTGSSQIILDGSYHWVQGWDSDVSGLVGYVVYEYPVVRSDGYGYNITEVDETGDSATRKVKLNRQMGSTGSFSGVINDFYRNYGPITLSTGGNSQANTWVKIEGKASGGNDQPTIVPVNNGNSSVFIVNADNIWIKNLGFHSASYQNAVMSIVYLSDTVARVGIIEGCKFSKHCYDAVGVWGECLRQNGNYTNVVFKDNEFYDLASTANYGICAIKCYPITQSSGVFINNYIHDINMSSGRVAGIITANDYEHAMYANNIFSKLYGNSESECFAIGLLHVAGASFKNNTIYDIRNSGAGDTMAVYSYYASSPGSLIGLFINNIVAGADGHSLDYGVYQNSNGGSLAHAANNIFNNVTDNYGGNFAGYDGGNDLNINPYFADVDNDDFTPQNTQAFSGGVDDLQGNPAYMGACPRTFKPYGALKR